MSLYRRPRQAGGTYIFTVNLHDRRQWLMVDHIDDLRAAVRSVKADRPFEIEASVVLPEHLHMIWTLPAGDADFGTRWRLIKSRFSKALPLDNPRRSSHRRQGERAIWQRRFFDHLVRDAEDRNAHIDYIHYNPVKHGLVARPVDWPHSSIHRFIRRGRLDEHWGTSGPMRDMDLQ